MSTHQKHMHPQLKPQAGTMGTLRLSTPPVPHLRLVWVASPWLRSFLMSVCMEVRRCNCVYMSAGRGLTSR